jgi:hypothetical protein
MHLVLCTSWFGILFLSSFPPVGLNGSRDYQQESCGIETGKSGAVLAKPSMLSYLKHQLY